MEIALKLTEEQIMYIIKEKRNYECNSKEVAERSIEYIIHELKHRIDKTLPKWTTGDSHLSRDKDRYTFIPASFTSVVDSFLLVRSHARASGKHIKTFLDIGCGIGNIMLIPYSLGFISHGIEYDKHILEYALFPVIKKSIKRVSGIYKMDALDFNRYNEYDIIYYYCPMCNRVMEENLEKKIQSEMKVGAYLIILGGVTTPQFTEIGRNVWVK